MTTAVFETAAISDAIKKASRVAPAKGQAFDKAAGVVIDCSPESTIIRATDLQIFYQEWVDAVEVTGDRAVWRLPAQLLASVLASLPIGTGKTVTFEHKDNVLMMTAGRTKARFNLIDSQYYPIWTAFDPDSLIKATDLGGRIGQVSWAASNNVADAPWCGVHLNGQRAIATDRYRLASVPLEIPDLESPITVPGNLLRSVLNKTGDVEITVEERQLLIMPDEHSQIRAVCYAQEYPKADIILQRASANPDRLTVRKTQLIEMIMRAQNFAGSDRTPLLRIFIGQEELAVMMANTEVGLLGDVIDLPGQAVHKRVEYKFTPKNLLDALNNAPNEEVSLGYSKDKSTIFYIDGGTGYEACVAPRASSAGE